MPNPLVRTTAGSLLRFLGFLIYLLIATAIGLEAALRLFPSAIPLTLLIAFDDDLRLEIAERRGLQTSKALRRLPRDDGGPPLHIYLPHSQVSHAAFDGHGAVQATTLDSQGFCNPEPTPRSPLDVLTVGGSIAWCHRFKPQDTWTAQLSRLTGASAQNLSVPGIGPYEYLQVLKHFGVKLSPRIVLFNISEENDMRDVLDYQNYRLLKDRTEGSSQRIGRPCCSHPARGVPRTQ